MRAQCGDHQHLRLDSEVFERFTVAMKELKK